MLSGGCEAVTEDFGVFGIPARAYTNQFRIHDHLELTICKDCQVLNIFIALKYKETKFVTVIVSRTNIASSRYYVFSVRHNISRYKRLQLVARNYIKCRNRRHN